MFQAYVAQALDTGDPDVKTSAMQAALTTKQDAAAFLTTLVSIGGTSGSGNLARVTSPTFVTPVLGAATGTSIVTSATGSFTGGVISDNAGVSASSGAAGELRFYSGAGATWWGRINATGFDVNSGFGIRFHPGGALSSVDAIISRNAAGVVQIGTTAANASGSLACANVTASGTVTVGSAGYAMAAMGGGDIRLNNGTADTPGIHWCTGANANWGMDVSSGTVRLVRNLDESGGVVFATWTTTDYKISSSTTTSLTIQSTGASGKAYGFASDASGNMTIGDGTNNLLTLTSTLATFLRAVVLGVYTVGTLPSAASNTRARAFVTDSNFAFNSTNLGSTVTAGGSTLVPVFSNGTNWVIG